jgi:hypothetical protein
MKTQQREEIYCQVVGTEKRNLKGQQELESLSSFAQKLENDPGS